LHFAPTVSGAAGTEYDESAPVLQENPVKRLPLIASSLLAFLAASTAVAAPPVLIEPVKAQVDKNWLYEIKDSRAKAGATREADARAMADDMARNFQVALDKSLRAHGFQVANGPTGGALRLTARLDDVYVSAPENTASGVTSFTRQTGRATLRVQARDASGAVVMQSEQRSDAGDMGRLQRATDVSNRFWFEALFRDWSEDVAKELKKKVP